MTITTNNFVSIQSSEKYFCYSAAVRLMVVLLMIIIAASCRTDPIVQIYYDRSVLIGDSATFRWNVENVPKNTTVTITDLDTNMPLSGEIIFVPQETQRYQMQVVTKKGIIKKKTRTIEVRKPSIVYFTAEPFYKGKDEMVRFNWQVKNTRKVHISGIELELDTAGVLEWTADSSGSYSLIVESLDYKLEQKINLAPAYHRRFIIDERPFRELEKDEEIVMEILQADRSDIPKKVVLKVIAVDRYGNYITGLAPPYTTKDTAANYFKALVEKYDTIKELTKFRVREIRERSRIPYDIALTLDYSGSMETVINDMESAMMSFISNKHRDDRIAVVRFDENIVKECSLLRDPMQIVNNGKFDGLENFGGSSAMYAATDVGMKEVKYSKNNKVMLLFTDGNDNASLSYFTSNNIDANAIADELTKYGVKLVVIAFGDNINNTVLKELARLSDGIFYEIKRKYDIDMILNELNFTFRNYYEITYRPVHRDGDRIAELVYDNNLDESVITDYPINFYDTTDLSGLDIDLASFAYKDVMDTMNLRPVMPPQVVLNFMFDSAIIENQYRIDLNNYLGYMRDNEDVKIVLIGHTDLVGNEAYNKELSETRAARVKEYFIRGGIAEDRIQVIGYGSGAPIFAEETEEWMARENRRVEAVFCK
jgi:Mg-chelatase subunit ChlD